jgi:hypothetical protein
MNSGPNWKNFQKLLEYEIAHPETEHRKFDMGDYIGFDKETIGDSITVGEVRSGVCNTACCLFGDAVIALSRKSAVLPLEGHYDFKSWVDSGHVSSEAMRLLGLTDDEADHVSLGYWYPDRELKYIPHSAAIDYLRKAIAERNVMVTV